MALSGLPAISAPLPWQGSAWARLHDQLDLDRFPQALLISGSPGIGKTRLALALARLLLCHRPSAGHNCGHCSACELSRSGAHGDFRWVQPEEGSRVIKIDQVREAVNFANWTAGFGQRKVLVLAPADAMNTNAANALLKSLEEPAANTHLILVCQRLHGVPATIRSRCQLLKLPVPPAAESLQWLDTLTGERETSASLLQLTQGRPLEAEALYRDTAAERSLGIQAALEALIAGRAAVPELVAALEGLAASELLALLVGFLEREVRGMDGAALRSRGRAVFALLDRLRGQQAAIAGGSNPNQPLFCESLMVMLHRELGPTAAGAKMQGHRGSAGPSR
jgi:DNA polymerase III subunit delta'